MKKCSEKLIHREQLAKGGQHKTGGGGARADLWATNIGTYGAAAIWYGRRVGVTTTIRVILWPGCGGGLGFGFGWVTTGHLRQGARVRAQTKVPLDRWLDRWGCWCWLWVS